MKVSGSIVGTFVSVVQFLSGFRHHLAPPPLSVSECPVRLSHSEKKQKLLAQIHIKCKYNRHIFTFIQVSLALPACPVSYKPVRDKKKKLGSILEATER